RATGIVISIALYQSIRKSDLKVVSRFPKTSHFAVGTLHPCRIPRAGHITVDHQIKIVFGVVVVTVKMVKGDRVGVIVRKIDAAIKWIVHRKRGYSEYPPSVSHYGLRFQPATVTNCSRNK